MRIEMNSEISEVTVFRDGARVTRTGKEKVKAGEHVIIVSNISGHAMEDSFRVKGKGAATLKGIDVSKKQVVFEPEGDTEALVKELRRLQKEQQRINEKIDFYDIRVTQMMAIQNQFTTEVGKWVAIGETEAERVMEMDDTTFSVLKDLKIKLRELQRKLEEIQDKIRVVQENLNKVMGERRTITVTNVKVLMTAREATEIQLDITYQLHYAGWNPTYDVDIGEKSALLKRIAMVYNNSLEDWVDVDLIVSTASARPVAAVEPNPFFVNVVPVEHSTSFGFIGRAAMAADMDDYGEEEKIADIAEQYATSTETLSGTVIYDVPGKVTIESERDPHPITLTEEEFDSRKLYYWNAAAMSEVVAQDEITNGDSVILPGNVKVYAQGEFIGETYVDIIAPREEFRLGTRAAYDMKAEKKLIAKDTEKAGITRGKRRRDYRYRLEVKSFAKTPIEIRMVDVIPYSSSEKVEIELSDPTLPYKKYELGILEWEVGINPNDELEIEYEFTVNWEKELRLRPPLP